MTFEKNKSYSGFYQVNIYKNSLTYIRKPH